MKTPVLLFAVLLVWGCSSSTGGDDDSRPVESKVVLELRETYTSEPGTPQPTLMLRTEKEYGCINYVLRLSVRMEPPTFDVEILGIELPNNLCFTAFGPATASVDVPEIGRYTNIVVRNKGGVDYYTLAVDEASFRISGEPGQSTRIGDTLVWRYPERSFVFTCGTLVEDADLCTQFRDTLLARHDLQVIDVPAEGYWPYVRVVGGYYYNMPSLVCRYTDESDFHATGASLESFTRSVLPGHSGAGLALRNWRNESYASWLVRDSL